VNIDNYEPVVMKGGPHSFAVFSEDMRYRYELVRHWDLSKPRVAFILLNPSTADEEVNDPTIRRCIGFTKAWGFGGVTIVNIFALRSTDPNALYKDPDPVGPVNDYYMEQTGHIRIVVAWGNHGLYRGRGDVVLHMLRMPAFAFGLTRAGQPNHPLYLPRSAEVRPYAELVRG
jgi:hypothetical protein